VERRAKTAVGRATRQKILDAAIEYIDLNGEFSLRLNDVADLAGLNAPLIYRYFKDRDELIIEAQQHRLARGIPVLEDHFLEPLSAAETEEQFRRSLVTFLEQMFEPSRAADRKMRFGIIGLTQGRPELLDRVAPTLNSFLERLESALRRAKDLGWLRADAEPTTLAVWMLSQLAGRVVLEITTLDASEAIWDRLTLDAVALGFFGES
jgi:AcrR family transcriptional regulator